MSQQKKSQSHRKVEKPHADRMVELVRALQLIQDSLIQLRAGHVRHLASLSGQLRALLIDRSAKPLLISIADIHEKKLVVHCMPGADDHSLSIPQKDNVIIHVAGFPITLHRQYPKQIELSFPAMLKQNILLYKGSYYSAGKIIEWFANQAGGAHYATSVSEDFAALLSKTSPVSGALANILMQLGQATLEAGRQLLKTLVDLEIHAIFVIPAQPENAVKDQNFLFDAQYDDSPMRLSLLVNNRLMPSFHVMGLQGVGMGVCADRIIDWSAPRYIHASLHIDDELCTVLDIAVDGQRVGRARIQEPLFVLPDPTEYDVYHNRATNGEPQKFSFGLAEMVMYNCQLDPSSAAQAVEYFMAKQIDPNLQVVLYKPDSFGHKKKGTRNLQIEGIATKNVASDVLSTSMTSNNAAE